jgi:predicted RNase H-like HicB family nuclease
MDYHVLEARYVRDFVIWVRCRDGASGEVDFSGELHGRPGRTERTSRRSFCRGSTSFGASVPDLPGCVAVGATRAEVERLIQEAIARHLDGLRRDGVAEPDPQTQVTTVDG